MPNLPEGIVVNGRLYSHYSLRIQPTARDGRKMPSGIAQHVKSVSYEQGVSLLLSRGTHPVALPRADGGDYTCSGQIVVTLEYWARMLKMFGPAEQEGITDVDFDLLFVYKPPRGEMFKLEWEEASIIATPGGSAQGDSGGVFKTLSWHVRTIKENDRCLVRKDQDA
jgi:hypothetical protein